MGRVTHTVYKVDVQCTAQKQCMKVEYNIHAEVFEPEFTFIPLLPESVAIANICIDGPHGRNAGDAHLMLYPAGGSGHTLFCTAKGVYRIQIETMLSYANKVKSQATIPSVTASDTFCTVTVPDDDVVVTVTPSIWSKNLNPSSSADAVQDLDTLPEGKTLPDTTLHSFVHSRVPPATSIQVKWTANHVVVQTPKTPMSDLAEKVEEKPKVPEKKKEMVVTSSQEVLYSLGGGVCHVVVYQTYNVTNGSLSGARMVVPFLHGSSTSTDAKWTQSIDPTKKCKILSVEGPSVRGWDCHTSTSEEAQASSAAIKKQQAETNASDGTIVTSPTASATSSKSGAQCLVLTVNFDCAIESTITYIITAELEMVSTSCKVCLPSFTPLGVNRNKGAIAVQAQSSTEIKVLENDAKGMTKVDIAELPGQITTRNSVLFGYKYLTSNHRLCLDTVKHDDVDVIIALCESATYRITHTGDQLLYDLAFNLKNTQCQYLKILLPPRSSVWTASVGGEVVKPSTDQTGKTLLPLVKGSDVAFTMKLVFVCPAPKLPKVRGEVTNLAMTFPMIDLPVTHIRAEVYVPETHIYSEFVGGIEEVESYNQAEVLRCVHNSENYSAGYNIRAKKSKARGVSSRAMNSYSNSNSYGPPPPQMQMQQVHQQLQQMQQVQQQTNYMMQPQQQMQMNTNMNHRGRTNVLRRERQASICDSMSEESEEDRLSIADDRYNINALNEDDGDDDDMSDDDTVLGEGAMAQGIKPLAVSTNSLQNGKKYLFEKLLLPSSTLINISCDTCLGKKKKERTLHNDK